jgi:hypothetical protein
MAGPSTLRGREPSHRTTRATPKVKEAESAQSKLKEKGKATVVEEVHEELQREELERLLAKKADIQEMIDNLLK